MQTFLAPYSSRSFLQKNFLITDSIPLGIWITPSEDYHHHPHAQLCLTLYNPMDCNSPGSSVSGISQARILEWVTISSSRGSSRSRDWTCDSCVSCISGGFFTHWAIEEALWGYTPEINSESALCNPCCPPITLLVVVTIRLSSVQSMRRVWLFVTPWTAAGQASLSITNFWNVLLLKLMSIELVMPSSHLILCRPLLLLDYNVSLRLPALDGSFMRTGCFYPQGQHHTLSL